MIFFWFALAIIFLIAELMTFTFGFIFITVGAVITSLLLVFNIIASSDFIYQLIIMLFFCILSFIFFYKSFKRSKDNKSVSFKEDMTAVVIDNDLTIGNEGKIKWSGTICNAMIDEKAKTERIPVGANVIIEEFKGNIAIVKEIFK